MSAFLETEITLDIDEKKVSKKMQSIEKELAGITTNGILGTLDKQIQFLNQKKSRAMSGESIAAINRQIGDLSSQRNKIADIGNPQESFLSKGMGEIGGSLGQIIGYLSVGAIVMEALKPVGEMLGQLVKMVSIFLRPIAEAFMVIIVPLMNLLRPIIQIFNVAMMPFRMALAKLTASAAMDMARAGQTGDAALLGSGLTKSLMGIGIIGIGLETALMKVGLQLLKMATSVLVNLVQIPFKFIVLGISTLVGIFSKTAGAQLAATGGVVAGAMTGFIDIAFKSLEIGVDEFAQTQIDFFSNTLRGLGMTAIADMMPDLLAEGESSLLYFSVGMGALFTTVADQLSFIWSDDFKTKFKTQIENMDYSGIFDSFKTNTAATMVKATDAAYAEVIKMFEKPQEQPEPFVGGGGSFGGVGYSGSWGEESSKSLNIFPDKNQSSMFTDNLFPGTEEDPLGITSYVDKSWTEVQTIMNGYNAKILEDTKSSFASDNGTVTKTVSGGLQKINTDTQNFANNITTVSRLLKDAIAEMQRYASLYAKAKAEARAISTGKA